MSSLWFRMRTHLQHIPSVRAMILLSFMMSVVIFATASILLLDFRQKELNHARGELSSLTRILSEQTTRTFESVALALRVTQERLSDDFGRNLALDSQPVSFLLKARSSGLPQIKSIFVIDQQGLGVNSSRVDFIRGLDMSRREFFRHFVGQGRDDLYISAPEQARVDGKWSFYISIPLLDSSSTLRGVLVAAMSIESFESLYESIDLDFVSRISLLNTEGNLLAGKPHDEKTFGGPAQIIPLATLQQTPEGHVVEFRESASDGFSPRLAAFRQVSKFPLVVSASVDENEALTPWYRIVRPIVVGLVLTLIFLWTTTFLMARNLLRKDALESAIRESDEQLRHMVQSVRDAIVTVNSTKHIVLFNGASERMFGREARDTIGLEIEDFFASCLDPLQRKTLMQQIEKGWQTPSGDSYLLILSLRDDERQLPVELSLSGISVRGEMLLTAVFRDLTERQRSERELLETNRQLQALSAALQTVREEQRAKFSRELHDELGQMLTGMRMEVSWLGQHLPNDQKNLMPIIGSIKNQIDQTISSVRRISSELRPLVLDDLGFSAAANWYVDQFLQRTGLTVLLDLPVEDPKHGDVVATALFRVLQESLTNIARHAKATKVEVKLTFYNNDWVLSVRDDGVGFVFDPGKGVEIGLIGMRERAQILRGRFSVTTAPGQGTLVEVHIPATLAQEEA